MNGAKGVEAVLAVWLGYCGSFKFTRNSLATGVFLLRVGGIKWISLLRSTSPEV